MDNTLFINRNKPYLLVVQIYVDDIIFSATNEDLCQEFAKLMQGEFEMSMMGELNFFLGLQIKQQKNGIFISLTKYLKDLLKNFELDQDKSVLIPMSTNTMLDNDEKEKYFNIKRYHGMIGSLLYLTASRLDI